MGKFGKVNRVTDDLEKYSVGLLGESGIGKTTLMKEVAEELYGEDGYIIFNIGREQGIDAIDGAVYEDIPDWKKFVEVTGDIITNKKTDYPNLKVVIMDTLDQLLEIAAPETIRRYNIEHQMDKNFRKASTLNQAWGGFGSGQDMNCQMILDKVWELKAAGVQTYWIGHVKTKEIIDPVTNTSYTSLTTDISQRDFANFKNKLHLIGIGCIDRTIEKESTGRKNIVTKEEITFNKVKSESRKIVFRDDNYSVDSKSRFANIVSEIPFDPDSFIKAFKDAVNASKTNKPNRKAQEKPKAKDSINDLPMNDEPKDSLKDMQSDAFLDDIENEIGMNPPEQEPFEDLNGSDFQSLVNNDGYPDDLASVITETFKTGDKDVKAIIRGEVKRLGKKISTLSPEELKSIYDMINPIP